MKKMIQFLKDTRGVVLIEFAFILPILLLLTFPMIDYARYILLQQKLIKVPYVWGDAITMSRPVEADTTLADINADATYLTQVLLDNSAGPDLVDTLPQLMLPFREAQGENLWQAVITHVRKPDPATPPQIEWQYDEDGRSFTASGRTSNVGVVSGFNNTTPATLPTGLINTMGDGEEIIVVEVSGVHRPITPIITALGIPFVSETTLNYTSYMRTRYGSLRYMWPNNCPPGNAECLTAATGPSTTPSGPSTTPSGPSTTPSGPSTTPSGPSTTPTLTP